PLYEWTVRTPAASRPPSPSRNSAPPYRSRSVVRVRSNPATIEVYGGMLIIPATSGSTDPCRARPKRSGLLGPSGGLRSSHQLASQIVRFSCYNACLVDYNGG